MVGWLEQRRWRRAFACAAGLLALWMPLTTWSGGVAASGADPSAADTKVEVIAPADIPARADADEQFIRTVRRRAQSAEAAQRIERSLNERGVAVERLAERSTGTALDLLSVRRLESLRRHWQLHEREIARTRAELARELNTLSDDAAGLANRRSIWQGTRAAAASSAPALVQRADEVIAQIERAEADVAAPLSNMLDRGRAATRLATQVQAVSAAVQTKIDDHDRRLTVMDTPPLWQAAASDQAAETVGVSLRNSLAIERGFAHDHDAANARLLPALGLLAAALLPLIFWLKRRAAQMVADGAASAQSMQALARPLAAWMVLVALGAVLYDLQGPIMRQQFVMLLAWLPVLVLLQRRILTLVGPWAYLSAVFYLLNVVASLFVGNLLVYRVALLGLNLLMLATLLVLGWRALQAQKASVEAAPAAASADGARAEAPDSAISGVTSRWLLLTAGTVVLASVVSNVLGNISLATMLTGAVLDSSYAALALYAGASVVVALFQVLLARPQLSRLTKRHAGTLIPVAARLGRTLLVLGWLAYTLQEFRIYRPLLELVVAALTFELRLGGLTLSLGSVVAFAAATWVAFWLARTIRLLLAEDVLPALQLPRGVGHTVSTLSYYSILMLGLLTALAAAGFKVGELAIVFGALGVGIGFGLQDVVKNFVAGLILMFERPIQPGDVVDVVGVTASVRDVGLRATTLRTFDGADVVVPNGMLLADKLINWTLTGNSRRINIDVSTGYDVNPQKTIDLLLGVATRLEGIGAFPPPTALMTALAPGELQFNLRAWTTQTADWVAVRSELAMRIHAALAEAGIAVPLPQRELHVRTDGDRSLSAAGDSGPTPSGPPPQSAGIDAVPGAAAS
jgi:potassium-dependent mechanosensitive channel